MVIQKEREDFEKLPKIEKIIKNGIHYNDRFNCYQSTDGISYLTIARINGAWYAFQEQQKQINEIKAMAESWINQDYTHNSDSTDIKIQQMKDCGRDIIRKINGELK